MRTIFRLIAALVFASSLAPLPAAAESKIHRADLLVPESGCASTLSAADYGNLRAGLNALAKVLR